MTRTPEGTLTTAEYLALEPREQDALVAEKVMGATWVGDGSKILRGQVAGYIGTVNLVLREAEGDFPCEHLPRYTTDISAAWEVVEKMLADRYLVSMEHRDFWVVDINPGVGKSPTAPLAICIAALKAVGVIHE